MTQLSLPLILPEIFSADNFFISSCNSEAYDSVLNKSNWTAHTLYLYGEAGSGKSHLSYIWAQKTGATIVSPHNIKPEEITGNCLVEDIEQCHYERALLHLFNHCKDIGVQLLMNSHLPPSGLPFTLPDLTSRLRGCQLAVIHTPDDEVISAVLHKQFADRQLLVGEEVISYIATHTERSLEKIKGLVDIIDKDSLIEGRNITIPFVKKFI